MLRQIVETYMDSGEPVGSRTISRLDGVGLSPATIRNVMADLEDTGLLFSPHTSAGRLPTEAGLRLFVDGLLEIGNLTEEDRQQIEAQCAAAGISPNKILEQATDALSGLSHHAGLVAVPKQENPLKHIEFVSLSPDRARWRCWSIRTAPSRTACWTCRWASPASALQEASNYLSARLVGRTLAEARAQHRGRAQSPARAAGHHHQRPGRARPRRVERRRSGGRLRVADHPWPCKTA